MVTGGVSVRCRRIAGHCCAARHLAGWDGRALLRSPGAKRAGRPGIAAPPGAKRAGRPGIAALARLWRAGGPGIAAPPGKTSGWSGIAAPPGKSEGSAGRRSFPLRFNSLCGCRRIQPKIRRPADKQACRRPSDFWLCPARSYFYFTDFPYTSQWQV